MVSMVAQLRVLVEGGWDRLGWFLSERGLLWVVGGVAATQELELGAITAETAAEEEEEEACG